MRDSGNKKILVVDDDNDILEVIRIILEDEGYNVTTLLDGRNTMNSIVSDRPDLILLDVMLGGIDGRDICKAIKTDDSFKSIPVIMISASHNLQGLLALPESPNGFLSKPFDISRLISLVNGQFAA